MPVDPGQVSPLPRALRARLHYVHLGSPEPARLAQFYAELFGVEVQQRTGDWICRAADKRLVFSLGERNSLMGAGYAADAEADVERLGARICDSRLEPTSIDQVLFAPGACAFRDPDGNRVSCGVPSDSGERKREHAPPARLQHVVVGSTDVARMVRFYASVVGMLESDEVHDDQGELRTCFMRSDDEHHSLAIFKTPLNRLDHHCYELPDWNAIRDWGDRLAAREIPIKWGPGRHGPGNNLFIFFHDPDGNWVELSAELERVSDDRPVGIWPHAERTLNTWGRGLLRS